MDRTHVLIAEDNHTCYRVLEGFLKRQVPPRYNLHIERTQDGPSTVAVLRGAASISVLFLDMILPDLSGYDIVSSIRSGSIPGYERLPVIGVSANAMVHERDLALKLGCNAFLEKPILRPKLQEIIRTYFP